MYTISSISKRSKSQNVFTVSSVYVKKVIYATNTISVVIDLNFQFKLNSIAKSGLIIILLIKLLMRFA